MTHRVPLMPDWILLLPIGFPLIGALVLLPLASRLTIVRQQWLALGFLVIEIGCLLLNIAPGSHRLSISNWELASFVFALQMDGLTQLLLLTIFILLAARWLVAPPHQPFDFWATLVLTAALLLAAADSFPAVFIAWTLLDLALFVWRLVRDIDRATTLRGLAIGLLTGMAFFAGAILLPSRPSDGAWLIALALWARLGLFPFHSLLPTRGAGEFDLWFARGIPLIAASNLWLHWSAFHVAMPIPLVGVLAGISLVVAAIWVWRATDTTMAVNVGVSHALALVPLSIAWGGEIGIALALWQVLAIAFALAFFEIAQCWRAENHHHYPRLVWCLGLLALAGLPLTPAFLGRIGLYTVLLESGEWLLWLLAFVTTLIILAPLWNLGLAQKGAELREPTRVEYTGLALVLLAFAALAFAPMIIAPVLAPSVGEAAERALDRVVRPSDGLGVGVSALGLILPVILAFFARVLVSETHPSPHSFVARLARISDLEWLEDAASRIGAQLGVATRNVFMIMEENPTVWILLIGLWVAILISIAR